MAKNLGGGLNPPPPPKELHKAAQTRFTVYRHNFSFFDEGGSRSIFNIQYQYLDRGGRGLVFCSRFSAERLLQKGHLFASGDSNTGMSYQYLPSGKKHLTRNISKESGHCLASQLLLRIEWSQLAHINSAACCLVEVLQYHNHSAGQLPAAVMDTILV